MNIEKIKDQLARNATIFTINGFESIHSEKESWIGNVFMYAADEEIPVGENGEKMLPFFQLSLVGLPFVTEILKQTKVITVFVSEDFPFGVTPNGKKWQLREYDSIDNLVVKKLKNPKSTFIGLPLVPDLIEQDFPVFDSIEIPEKIRNEIVKSRKSGIDYWETVESNPSHKVGGYPAFCQAATDFGEGFEFAIQIISDQKANINIIDDGRIFLAKNAKTGEWVFYCDFY